MEEEEKEVRNDWNDVPANHQQSSTTGP